ncbi:MAG: 50S ribosomal protein L10 [Actinomycetota bacterium]|nr:50S ribosomal protein L10 [Actinomycetota bacterium]
MPKPDKVQAVEDITGRFQESTAALLTEYRGLSVSNIGEVRNALREVDADYKVLKNTLARIAAREVGMEDLVALLEGPTAIAFCKGDAVAAAKALDEAARKYPVLVIKGGILRGKIMNADQARALASLEPREVQLAKIAMMMNTPLQQTVNVFAAALRDLGSMLAQVLSKKESGELPSGDGAAAAAPEAPAAASDAAASDETGDRGAAEVAEVAADTESDTSDEAAASVAAPNEATDEESTETEAAAGGEDQKEE